MNSALRKVGSFHLDADDTSSTTYEIVNQAYNDAVLEIFAENAFIMNTRKLDATSVNNIPYTDQQYEHSFTFPLQLNILLYITDKDSKQQIHEYAIYNNRLYTDSKEICMYYTDIPDLSVDASSLPPYLNRLIVLHVAQAIAIELSGSENRHELLHVQYTKALRRARVLEARQGPRIEGMINESNSRLIDAHHNGSVY